MEKAKRLSGKQSLTMSGGMTREKRLKRHCHDDLRSAPTAMSKAVSAKWNGVKVEKRNSKGQKTEDGIG